MHWVVLPRLLTNSCDRSNEFESSFGYFLKSSRLASLLMAFKLLFRRLVELMSCSDAPANRLVAPGFDVAVIAGDERSSVELKKSTSVLEVEKSGVP